MSNELIMILSIGFAGIATGLGALPILVTERISRKTMDVLLGFAAGIMLAATSFSLILPSIEAGGSDLQAVLVTCAGILVGGAFLDFMDKHSPHIHLVDQRAEGGDPASMKKIWLFVIAIALHNFPEGLATGVGFGTGDVSGGMTIAVGIGIQNLPEGLAVALALRRENYSRLFALGVATLTGLIEPIGAVLGLLLIQMFQPLIGFILALAAGAMLFVISDEIIPETHSGGYEREATYGILFGFVVMLILDILLG
ncbi:MAG: ZIP family metal transporter [Tissierellia bacterium]|nr:ZIP family metal transporter [Tissierellia bacterium]